MSSDLNPLFSKGISEHYGIAYKTYPAYVERIFRFSPMDGRYTDEQLWEMYALPGNRNPGEGIPQGQFKPSWAKRYIPVNYALGDFIAQEDWDDDEYGVIARVLPAKGGALAKSHAVLREIVGANFFKNIAFAAEGNNTAGMSDGRPLFSTAHPVSKSNTSVTYGNKPSTAADLSIASFQAAAINLRLQQAANDTEVISNSPQDLVINPTQHYIASQILKGQWEVNTADRNENFIRQDNVNLIEWPYLHVNGTNGAATNAYNGWFVKGQEHYLRGFNRQETRIKTDYSINTLAYIFVSYCRFVLGASDWRGVYGSSGN